MIDKKRVLCKLTRIYSLLAFCLISLYILQPHIVSALSELDYRCLYAPCEQYAPEGDNSCESTASVSGPPLDGHVLPASHGGVGLEEAIDAEGRVGSTGGKVTFSGNAKLGQPYRDYYITMRWRYALWNWNGTTSKGPESADFYAKVPRILVTNPRTGKSIITVVMESGPAPWTGIDRGSNNIPKQGWSNPQDGTPPEYKGRVAGLPPVAFQALGATQRMANGSGDDLLYSWAPDQSAQPGPTTPAGAPDAGIGGDASGCQANTSSVATLPTGTDAELRTRLLNNPLVKLDAACQRTDVQSGIATTSLVQALVAITEQAKIKIIITAMKCDHKPGTLHEKGRAVDLVATKSPGPEQTALFQFLYDNRQALKINELIYAYPPPGTTTLDEGKEYGFNAPTIAGHRDHIHLAVNP